MFFPPVMNYTLFRTALNFLVPKRYNEGVSGIGLSMVQAIKPAAFLRDIGR